MAIPDCLVNFIGLRGARPADESGSTLWINDMPDTGIARLEAMSDVDSRHFRGLWEKVYGRAIQGLASDIRRLMKNKIRTNDLLQNAITGKIENPYVTIAGAAEWSGWHLSVKGSPLMELPISHVVIPATAGTVTVKMFDLQDGVELYTKDFASVSGFNTFKINETVPLYGSHRDIGIVWDRTGQSTYQVNPAKWISGNDCGMDECGTQSLTFGSGFANARPFSDPGANPTTATLTYEAYAKGMIVHFGIRCSLIQFICEIRDVIQNALRMKSYIELLWEVSGNDTLVNRYTLVKTEEIDRRLNAYQAMYEAELAGVLESITYEFDSDCFDCHQAVGIGYIKP